MADITRDSYQDSQGYCLVTFQRNKDVPDFELNEMQRIALVRETKALRNIFGDTGACKDSAGLVTTDGVTANQITISAGIFTVNGYTVELFNPIIITGLTTPGANRTDCVWVKIDELEVTSSADPNIATQALGETAVRKKARLTFGVTENSYTPPANNDPVWTSGGYHYMTLAHLFRTATTTVTSSMIVDRRYAGQHRYAIQMANLFMTCDSVYWDGTNLQFKNLTISFPQPTNTSNILYQGDVSFAPADGDAVGFDGESGFTLRRDVQALTAFALAGELGTTAVMKNQQMKAINSLTPDIFLIAWRTGTDIILRNGVKLRTHDFTSSYGRASSSKSRTQDTNYTNQHRFLMPNDKYTAHRDVLGWDNFLGVDIRENWQESVNLYNAASGPVTNASKWYYSSAGAGAQSGVSFQGLGVMNLGIANSVGGWLSLSSTNSFDMSQASPNNFNCLTMEFTLKPGTTNITTWGGICTTRDPNTAGAGNFKGFKWPAGGTSFHGVGGDGTVGTADIPLASATSAGNILRMVYLGPNSPWGVFDGTAGFNVGWVLFFVDGVLAGSSKALFGSTWFIVFEASGSSETNNFQVGPLRFKWSTYAGLAL